MAGLAVTVGRFVGAVLAECAPVLVEVIRECMRDTAEDGARRDDLRERLLERLRDSGHLRADGRAGKNPPDSQAGPGVGG